MMGGECRGIINKATWLGFGLPNGVIAFVLTWFAVKGGAGVTFEMMQMELLSVSFITGLLIPFFGPLNLSGYLKKSPGVTVGLARRDHTLAKWIPLNMLAGAVVISVLTGLIFGVAPVGILTLIGFDMMASPMAWIVFKVVYTILVAAFSGYLTCLQTVYSLVEKGKLSVGVGA